jgi:ATP-binding cassette subfamily B protein
VDTPLKQYGSLLLDYLRPQWPGVLLLAMLILGHIGLQLASPQIVRYFIDAARAGSAPGRLSAVALLFIAVAVASQALSIAASYLGASVAWTATNALRQDLTLHCLHLDMPFHKARTPGELIERLDGDVTALGNFFSQMTVRLLANGLLTLGILALLFREDWRVSLVGVGYALLTVVLLRQVQKPATRAWADARQANAELMGFMGERLAGTEDIRALGAEPHVMARLYRLMRTLLHKGRKAALMGDLTSSVGYAVYVLSFIATLALSAPLFLKGAMTIGTVYLLVDYMRRLDVPLEQVRHQATDLQQATASIERVGELFHIRSRLVERPRAALPAGALDVAFERVTFRYDDGPPGNGSVLDDVSFTLAPGQVLGLLGRTGSGKTTLTRLLFRLYDPTRGAIRLGGVDIRDVRLGDLRGRVGLVTQDVQLFQASVRDNLTFFSRRIPDAQILALLDGLGLREWVQSLPGGLDSELQGGGRGLSAGEAQLLALARVFLKDPGLVVLDEASSRLDPATERLLERAVGRLLQDRSAIVIAHRLTTVQRADEIMILGNGRIRERGQRQVLASDPASRFYELLQTGLDVREPQSNDVREPTRLNLSQPQSNEEALA